MMNKRSIRLGGSFMAEQLDLNHGYYYQFLNPSQKNCYDELLLHMRQFETQFSLNPVSSSDYLVANRAVLDDHPELWWADTPARYQFNLAGKVTSHTFLQLKGNEKQLTETIARIAQQVLDKASQLRDDWQKALFFHDYIVLKTSFNSGRDTDGYSDQNLSSVFLAGNSVCAGYSRAFQLLCRSAGIECVYVTGKAVKNRTSIQHAWNLARINGSWTWIDCTWDDLQLGGGMESAEHDYFCLNDTWISKEHPIPKTLETGNAKARLAIQFPPVTPLQMEYYHVNGIYFETYNANAVYASVQAQEKTGRIRLRFGSTAELKKAVQDIVYRNNLTANAGLRITLDEVMCVLRIDKIA